MKRESIKYKKIISIIIAISLILPTVVLSTGWAKKSDANNRTKNTAITSKNDEYIEKLISEGYSQNKINQAKTLLSRVIFELGEITNNLSKVNNASQDPLSEDNQNDSEYTRVSESIDLKTGVQLLVRLEKDFGSLEKVLDEYLYSLQLGISLDTYNKDKKAYEQVKKEKESELDIKVVITYVKIEETMIQSLQALNNQNRDIVISTNTPESQKNSNELTGNNKPYTQIEDIKPVDPLAGINGQIGNKNSNNFK